VIPLDKADVKEND